MKQLKKGMMLNQFSEIDNPKEAYVFASNAVTNSREGGFTEIQLEPGTKDIGTVNDNIMGVIQGDNSAFVFTAQDVIIQYNSSGEAVNVVDDSNLQINYPIKGVFRMINNKRYLYWGDNVQPDKYICIDDLDKFKTAGQIDRDKITLLPTYTHPDVTIKSMFDTSSNLKVGMYSLVTRYLDYNMNGTDWSIPTVPIPVFRNAVKSYDTISGESTGEISGKSLVYTIENYDTRFPYIEFAVIRYTENGQEIYKLDSIDNIHSEYTVNFIDYSTSPQLSVDEITIPSSKYVTSSNMTIYDNRLIRSNLKEVSVDYSALQQFANTIRVGYVVKEIPYGIQDSGEELNTNGSAKSSKYYENKSLLRGEVYAIGIVPYYKNGQRLPVFHIPGREMDKMIDGTTVSYATYNTNVLHSRPNATSAWDSETIALNNNTKHFEALGISTPQRWQVYNTAFRTSNIDEEYYGQMSYFECRDLSNNPINYPAVSSECEYYPSGAIRHHKMPDCTLEPHYKYDSGQYYIRVLGINISDEYLTLEMLQDIDPNIVGYDIVVADRTYNKTIEDKGILTGNVAKKYYNGEDKSTASNLNKIYHQSMMMSYDNNVPKSFTNEMGTDYSVTGLGYFTSLPACSENIGYSSKNNNLDTHLSTEFLPNLVGFHSPKSKINRKAYSGSYMKFELEMFSNLESGTDGYYTVNNPNFFVHNNRYKWKSRETKHILVTSAYQRLYGINRPYSGVDTTVCEACGTESLYNRSIVTASYYDADSSYGEQISLTYPQPFINKTQQEITLYELTNSTDSTVTVTVADQDSDSAIGDAWGDKPLWANIHTGGSEQFNVVRPTQFLRDGTLGMSSTGYDCTGFYNESVNQGGVMGYSYVAITNYIPDVYSNLQGLTYYKNYQVAHRDLDDAGYNYFAGDVFISRFAFKRSFYGYVPNSQYFEAWAKNQLQADLVDADQVDWFLTDVNGVSDDKTNSFYEAVVIDTFYESDINPEFRQEGDTTWSTDNFKFNGEDMDQDPIYNQNSDTRVQLYYPKYYGLYAKAWCHLELNANSISRLTNDGEWDYYQLFPNYYKLNPVYNQLNRLVQFKPLSLQYDYCNVQTDFPNRVVWTDKAFNTDLRDTFRKFKVLNYLDVNGVDNRINNMYDHENTLWLLTNNNAYYVPMNSQQLQVEQQTAYLGNPSFMSTGAFRVKNSINFGGSRSRFAGIHTPYGYFYISENDYELYHNSGKIESIIQNISTWWRFNMGLDIVEKFKALNIECPYEDKRGNYMNEFAGYTLGYDPNHERLLVTKVDFIFPNLGLTTDATLVNNNYYYDTGDRVIYKYVGGIMTAIDMADYQHSYTLSYDLQLKQWVSFHSHHSEFTFFTSEYNAYCMGYSGTQMQLADRSTSSAKPLIVEFVNYNLPTNATLESFNFGLRSSIWNPTSKRFDDMPNDFSAYFMSYNSYQCTKFHSLVLSNGGRVFDHDTKAMYLRNGLYNVAGIKNYASNQSFLTQAYEEDFDGQPVPWDLATYSFTDPDMYNMRQLRDKYAITRLYIYPNDANQNIRIQLTDSNYKQTK